MKALEVHVVPLWQEPNGRRRLGMKPDKRGGTAELPVVGWCNVMLLELDDGERHKLLLTKHAAEPRTQP